MSLEFGDVILVPFPFTSHAASKRRPAVVVSNAEYNGDRPDVVVMAVTSQVRPNIGAGEFSVARWHAAGLLKPSAVKAVFATLEQRLVVARLGTFADEDRVALRAALGEVLG